MIQQEKGEGRQTWQSPAGPTQNQDCPLAVGSCPLAVAYEQPRGVCCENVRNRDRHVYVSTVLLWVKYSTDTRYIGFIGCNLPSGFDFP